MTTTPTPPTADILERIALVGQLALWAATEAELYIALKEVNGRILDLSLADATQDGAWRSLLDERDMLSATLAWLRALRQNGLAAALMGEAAAG